MALPSAVRRLVSRVTAVTLLVSSVAATMTMAAPSALAAGTLLFNQPFHDNTVDGSAGSVSLPTAPTGTNSACLTAAGNATANPLASCTTSTDAQGSGKLRFTAAKTSQEGGVFASTSVPTSQGLDVTFNSYQYGGTAADGIAFVLAAVNPDSPKTPTAIGQSGGALGYSANGSSSGLTDGYLGFGLDVYGNFSNKYEGSGCTDPANISQQMPGQVVVRGPGNGTVGYCPLQSSAATATSPALSLRAATRAASVVPVEVVFNPTSAALTTASGLVVPGGDYDINFTPVGGTAKNMVGALPVVPSGLFPASWVSTNGIPKQLAFGWVASTGAVTDFHEIDNVVVSSLNPVPQLSVSQTSYTASTLVAGSPVTYTVTATSSGATENSPVTVTETLPAGVIPAGAEGTGWVCAAPSGQSVSCTSSTSPFTSGTITVNGVVNSSSVTPAQVQSSSSALASSSDASPATSSSAPAGTLPSAPVVTAITPTNGAAGGGGDVTVSGTNLAGATAIEIGTSGEFTAGIPTTLELCSAPAAGCFTVTSATSLDMSAMPAHPAASVTVKVVSLGISGSGSYTYNPGPALLFPAPPGGEVNVAYSDQLTVNGGTSPFTWSISSGTLPPGLTLGASSGLLSGTPTTAGSYSFTVKVTDHSGLSNTEAATLAVIAGPSLNFPTPPTGWTHTVYGDTLTESGGTSPFTWSVSSGSLPAGISLSADGNLSGTPTATGTFSFTVKVTDADAQTATEATSLTISAGVSTTFTAPPEAQLNSSYSDTLTATGGTAPYAWSLNAGSLPPGLTLTSAGVLAGTPTTAGSYNFSVNVIDKNNGIATTSITLLVASGTLALSFAAPPPGDVGVAYSDTLTATGGISPYTWAVATGTLPAGLALSAAGVLSGTPTTAGTYSFTVKVTDSGGVAVTKATSITIAAAPTLSFPAPPSGQVGLAYSDTLTVTGGTGPFTWSVTSGSLPPGITLGASTGVLSGTPTTIGSSSFTVRVTDALGLTATEATSVVIGKGPLTIVQTADTTSAAPGSTVHFTVTVTNAAASALAGVTFNDPLSDVLDDAAYNGNATATVGTVSFASPVLTWTGNLAASATATITFSVTLSSPDGGNGVLSATINSATLGTNCAAGSTDPNCAVSVTVSGLTISSSAAVSSTTPGSVVRYTVTVTNTGQTSFTGATFTDSLSGVLDDAAYNADATTTAGTVSFTSPNLTWTGTLAPGATATITFSVTVSSPDLGNGVLSATIMSATAGNNCPSGGTDPRCAVTITVSGLTITNSANVTSTAPGSTVHYTVTVANSGKTPFSGATLTDSLSGVLDDAAYNSDAAATAGTVSFTSPNLTWTGTLAPGATTTITFSVTVRNPSVGDGVMSATITSATAGNNCPSGGTDPRCAVTVTVSGLTITSTADVATTAPGLTVHYTVTVANTGQTPFTGATFTESLAGVLDDATYNSDAAATAGTVTFASPNLTWTGNLAAGATATITFSVIVASPDTGNEVLSSSITSATPGSDCPAGGTDSRCSTAVPVAQLAITNVANVSTTTPGGVVRYTATFTNTGQVPYLGITIATSAADVFDDAVPNGDQTATSGTLTVTAAGVTWTGNIPVGGTVTVTGTVTVNNPDTGNKVLRATVSTAAAGSNCPVGSADPACSTTVTVLTPALTITTTANATSAVPGQVVGYTVTVANTGQTTYAGATVSDSFAAMLDDAVYDGDASATAGSLSYSSPALTWTGSLAVGASVTISYTFTVNNPDTGDKLLINAVSSSAAGSTCPPGSTATACQVTIPVLTQALDIVETPAVSTAAPGGVVHYTIAVTDTGQTPYTGAAISDSLSGVLDDASYNGDASATSGTVSFASPALSWIGNLAVGATVTITYSVTVRNPDTGNHVLSDIITSATVGSNCAPGSTDAGCTASVDVAQLVIVNQANVASTTPGGVVRYTATFTNTGQVAYDAITIATDASDVFDDAAPNGDQTATSGTLIVTPTGVTWTGDIPVGGAVTVTGTVTVKNPDTGNHVLTATLSSTAAGNNCPAGSSDTRCTTTIPVLTPALTIVKTANTTAAVPGQVIGYTITVTNTGQTPYSGATVSDSFAELFDDAAYDNDATATGGTVSYASPILTWTGSLAVGASVTISYTMTVNNPDTGDKQVINTVTSSDPGSTCPPGSASAACRVTVVVLTPGLDIVKTASAATVTPGGVVNYTITVTNTGQVPYTGAAFTDPLTGVLDDASYDGDAAATAGTVTFASPVLSWSGNLIPGAVATITYSVTVSNPDTGDRVLSNTVRSATAGSNCPTGSSDVSCTATVTVVSADTLTITATAGAASAAPGGKVTYTVTVANSGLTSFTGAAFTDPLSGVLDDAAYDSDASATAGTVTFTSPNLTWSGTVPASGTVTVTYSVTVHNPDTGNMILASTITSPSTGSDCGTGSTDPRCASTVTVSQLTINFTASAATTTPGGVVSYTATLANTGQTPYDDISVATSAAGIADDATGNGDQSATSGTLSVGPTGAVWTGDIPVGGTVTVTSSVTVDNPDTGDHILTATAVSDTPGSNCPTGGTDPRCTPVTDVLTPALTIVKTANASAAVPGQVLGYTITITNTGQTAYAGATVTDAFTGFDGDAVYDGDATATIGSLSYTSPVLTWTGALAVGAVAVISYTVTVSNPDVGDKIVVNSVSSADPGSTCPPGSTAVACRVTVPVLTQALDIVASTDVPTTTPGGVVRYTITVTNTGQAPYAGASFADPLPGVLDDAAYDGDVSATTGTATVASPVLSWTGDLSPGAAATITFSVTVSNPDTGDHILASTITSPTVGSNCGSGSTDPGCIATIDIAQLAIVNSASASTTTPGGTVRFTSTFTNTGQVFYDQITINIDATDILDDAVLNGDQTATSGTLSIISTGLSWTGDIPVGTSVTITGTVTVNNPDTGNKVLTGTVSTAAPATNCPAGSSDPQCTATVTVLTPALSIVKTASTSITVSGQVVGYTITVTNTGQTAYTGATVTDSLAELTDDAAYNNDAAATTGMVSYASPVLTWTGDLAPGAATTITYSVTVDNPDAGDKLMINTATSTDPGSTCPPGTTAPACRVAVAVLTPALTITKTAGAASALAGSTVHYTITVTDTGQTAYTGATVTDSLSGILGATVYNNDAAASTGTVSYASPVLTWTGNLPPGATATITYSVAIDNPDTGSLTLTNTAASTAAGSNCPSGGTDTRCTATVTVIPITISLTDLSGNFVLAGLPGSTVQQTGAVSMAVITNNPTGYDVTVQASSAVLSAAGTTDTIPIADLAVRGTSQSSYQPLSATTPVLTHTQAGPSAPADDALSDDYQITIPFVQSASYTTTLTYIAMATP